MILIVENMYFEDILFLFECSEAELRLTIITVRKDLLQNAPTTRITEKYRPIGQFEQYLSLSFYIGSI